MRLIDAEPELISDILDEMEIHDSRKTGDFEVHVGHHQTLGRMVVIQGVHGEGIVVELE